MTEAPASVTGTSVSSDAPANLGGEKKGKDERVKLTQIFKHDRVLQTVMKFCPYAWLKLKATNRLFIWRLDDQKFADTVSWLNQELSLATVNPHHKAAEGCIDIIWLLLIQGYNPRSKDSEGNTLLQKAVHSNKRNLVQLILEKGANVNIKGAFGYTALHECSYLGYDVICQLLLAYKANVDALSRNGSTPLLVAAREGHVDIVGMLLAANAHPDDGGERWTPLFIAAGEGHKHIVELLLQYGASATEACDDRLPYHEAIGGDHFDCAMILQKATPAALLGPAGMPIPPQKGMGKGGGQPGVQMGPFGGVPGVSIETQQLLELIKVGEIDHYLGDFETQVKTMYNMDREDFEALPQHVKPCYVAAKTLHENFGAMNPIEQQFISMFLKAEQSGDTQAAYAAEWERQAQWIAMQEAMVWEQLQMVHELNSAAEVQEAVSLSDKKPTPVEEQEVVDLGKESPSPEADSKTVKEDAAPVEVDM